MGELDDTFLKWRNDPVQFVLEVVGVVPTNQQREGLRALGKLYDSKLKMAYGVPLSDEEQEYAGKIGVSIRSGHGTGKDAFLAWVYLWLLTCFPGARGLVTAPTQHQLQDILWPEMRVWMRKSSGKLGDILDIQSEKAFRRGGKGADEAFVVNRTARVTGDKEEQAETLAGFHSDYMVLSVDEASGVADGVFLPLEGAQTGKFNIGVLISNPTRNNGYFYQTHHRDRKNWVALHWSCESSNMDDVTGTQAMAGYVARMKGKYGTDSNFYRMRVQGEFPEAEPDALISLELIMSAVDRDVVENPKQGLVLGVDVARMGDDVSIICPRRGMLVEPLIEYRKLDTMELCGHIMGAMADLKPATTLIDCIGIGAGVVDRLREMRKTVIGVNVAEAASREDRFVRLRDELYWRVRERFESRRIRIPNDDELIGELSSIKWKPAGSSDKVKVESKMEMKKRGLASPNRADALMLTEYFRDSVFRPENEQYFDDTPAPIRRGWMGA
jgi:hypothetical protein